MGDPQNSWPQLLRALPGTAVRGRPVSMFVSLLLVFLFQKAFTCRPHCLLLMPVYLAHLCQDDPLRHSTWCFWAESPHRSRGRRPETLLSLK